MTTTSLRPAHVGAALAGMLGVTLLTAAPAGAAADPAVRSVAPNQAFVGLVNGYSANATIKVVCPGPLHAGETGRPQAGQTIGVATPSAAATPAPLGNTGAKGTSINAVFVPTSSVGATIKEMFTNYGNQPIPVTITLPCTGSSTVLFTAHPRSHSARSYRVSVTFAATCDANVCPVNRPPHHRP